jgi:phage/plasmid-associated DNA primase
VAVPNTPTGTLDLRTRLVRPCDPADRITKLTDCGFHPDARSPLWDAFLDSIQPDQDIRAYLQRLMGLALIGKSDPAHPADQAVQAFRNPATRTQIRKL